MKKKILAIITAVLLTLPCLAQSAAGAEGSDYEKYEKSIELMRALEIYDTVIDEDIGFDSTDDVSRSDFINAALKMRFYSKEADFDYISAGRECGLVKSEDISGDKKIKASDAVRIIVTILDYGMLAEARGGAAGGYMKVAQSIDLLKGVKFDESGNLTVGAMLRLLENAIDAPLARMDIYGKVKYSFQNSEDVTVLSYYRDIYKIEGVVLQNEYTSLDGVGELGSGEIEIDGGIYYEGSTKASQMLGMNVKAYAYDEPDSKFPKLLYIEGDDRYNDEIFVLAEDVEDIDPSFTSLTYLKNNKKHTVRLNNTRRVIYNGVVYNDFTREDVLVDSGELRLIDNNRDNIYDIIFVTCFDTTMLVSYVSTYEKIIYNKYKNEYTLPYLELLDEDDKEGTVMVMMDGKEIGLSDIKENDIVSIAKSKNSKKRYTRVYVTRRSLTGRISAYDDENRKCTVTSDGGEETYELNQTLINEYNYAGSSFEKYDFKTDYAILFDVQGKIAAMLPESEVGWQYVLLLKMAKNKGMSSTASVRYMDADGEWHTEELCEKLWYQNEPRAAEEVYELLVGQSKLIPQMASIKPDAKGKIKYLRTGVYQSEYDKNLLTQSSEARRIARPSSSFDYEIFMNAGTKVFVMPQQVTYDEDDYYVSGPGYFSTNSSYAVTFFNLDEYNCTDLVAVKDTRDQNLVTKDMFLVTKIIDEMNEDGIYSKKLYGTMGNLTSVSAFVLDEAIIEGVQRGDVLQMTTDTKGRVNQIKRVYSISDGTKATRPANWIVDDLTLSAVVVKTDALNERFRVSFDDGSLQTMKIGAARTVTIYDVQKKTAEKAKIQDIKEGDLVVVKMRYVAVTDVIVIRF